MTRYTAFNSPLMLGFDHLERLVDSVAKSSADGYPPYNIEQLSENSIRITLAVAGFARRDLDVQLEDNQLLIRGRQPDEQEDRVFLHRGIAGRQFQRRFVLAEGLEVTAANMENGLLHIDLVRPQPITRTRTIDIQGS
ncbi:MAG: Hsp20 family protein [Rhodospirillales bacterium]|jgi:HSP20 family molecular chaperone IbpA